MYQQSSLFKSTLRRCQCQPTGTYHYHSLLLLTIISFFYSPSSSTPMSSPSPINISVYLSIANTVDTLLSCYHPLIPWLAMRQSDHSPLRLGQTIGLEHIHGLSSSLSRFLCLVVFVPFPISYKAL